MEPQEEQSHIVKGKRTKRLRPQSPVPFAMISANSSSGDDEMIDEDTNLSPTSTEIVQDSTEEEEDMANCLILLAQGQSRESPKQAEEEDHGVRVYKFNSRKFIESAGTGTGTGKAGCYVYECKTCNRTFSSFQALGGHRASHKKPKAVAVAVGEKTKQFLLSSDDEEAQFMKKNDIVSSLSLQLSSSRGLCGTSRSKVHECSICGAEFTSGQALGGHMRRHRAPMGTNTSLSLIPASMALDPDHEPKKPKRMLSLELDLNLPAPEDDHREPRYPLAAKQQQQQQQPKQPQQQQPRLVFSAPALVDCHY